MITLDLSTMLREYLRENKISQAECARAIGYSPTTLSRFIKGEYPTEELEEAVSKYLTDNGRLNPDIDITAPTQSETAAQKNTRELPEFFESRDAVEIIGLCSACQEYGQWGIVYGKPGTGKTHTLRHYAKLDRVIYISCTANTNARDLIGRIEKGIGLPRTSKSKDERIEAIKEFFSVNKGYLLIIDEADKLLSKYSMVKIDIIKTIFDDSNIGVVIAGESTLKTQISNLMHYIENRIGLYSEPRGLNATEVKSFLKDFNVDERAMLELVNRATVNRKACFRLLTRTLQNVLHLVKDDRAITIDDINKASSMMIL